MGSTLDSEKRTGETQSISSFLDDDKSLSSESSAKEGKLFAEFQAYCYSKGGEPTKKGYRTWKLGQANRHKGFVLRGKFFTRKQAEAKARDNPEIMLEMRPATKINGKVRVLE